MKLALLFLCAVGLTAAPVIGQVTDVNARYPWRLPDWLWQQGEDSYFFEIEDFLNLRGDALKLADLKRLTDAKTADALEEDIARRLGRMYSLRRLAMSPTATVVSDGASGRSLVLRFDPTFEEGEKKMLIEAARLFLGHALDQDVIDKAFARATLSPKPMDGPYEMENGEPKSDLAGRPVYTAKYGRFLRFRSKPASSSVFGEQMKEALSPHGGDLPVLVISRYRGDVWWGGAYIGFFTDPVQRLIGELPSQGYLSIRLNSDKLAHDQPHFDDSVFWASKLGHEITHNLGYDHPQYKNPAERDANNTGTEWAFIVSYEMSLLDKLKSLSSEHSK
jgi:hypothetical protein